MSYPMMFFKWIGTCISAPREFSTQVMIATCSVLEALIGLVSKGVAKDIRDIKDQQIGKLDDIHKRLSAEQKQKMVEAAVGSNKKTLKERNQAIADVQERQGNAKASIDEATARLIDAEAIDMKAKAFERVANAIKDINEQSGSLAINPNEVANMIRQLGQYDASKTKTHDPFSDQNKGDEIDIDV